MDEEKEEITQKNPEEEETPEEETLEQPQKAEIETPKEKTESPKEKYSDREKRYFKRMKDAEEGAKKAKEELAKSKKPVSDIDAILEITEATKGLESEEIAELKVRAIAVGKSLSDARNDENFILWQKAYKGKVEEEKLKLEPSTKVSLSEKSIGNITTSDLSSMPEDKRRETLIKMGWIRKRR